VGGGGGRLCLGGGFNVRWGWGGGLRGWCTTWAHGEDGFPLRFWGGGGGGGEGGWLGEGGVGVVGILVGGVE